MRGAGQLVLCSLFFVERRHKMGVRDWDIVTSYVDSVTTTLKTVTFPKVQEQVKVKNQGNANLTYTIGSQSGTLTPGQSVTVNEDISSFTIQAVSGTQAFELRAKEKGTEQTETETDVMTALAEKSSKTVQQQMLTARAFQDSLLSVNKSRAGFDDTASSVFTENWSNLTAWILGAAGSVQVSGNKLYGVSTNNGYAGAVHALSLASNENLRAVFNVSIPTKGTIDGIIIGVSNGAAGVAPARYAADSFGIYFDQSKSVIQQINLGTSSNVIEATNFVAGNYIVTVTVDSMFISVSAVKTDGTVEASCVRARAGFNVNNLYVFNSDSRELSGISIGLGSARKGLQTINPRTFGEGVTKTFQWTGDGTQSFRIYLPANYDSRIPAPLAICWHGHGSDETYWSKPTGDNNYVLMQKALVNAGYIVLSCSLNTSKTTWGNIASTNAYYQAYKYVRDNYAIGGVVWFANSMGGIESLNALSENKIPCVAWAGTSPTFDLQKNYNNATFTSVIKTAYGIASDGSDYATKTAGRNPALMNPSVFRGLPMWVAAASDDTIVLKVDNGDKLANVVANTAIEVVKVDVATGGHAFDITAYTSQIVSFFDKYVKS
jgi:hypothetical protein